MTTSPALPALDTLDDGTLYRLINDAGQILLARSEAELPAVVLETIREQLAEDNDTRTPLRAVFTTSEWDNGFFWDTAEVKVTVFDGRTEEHVSLDLDETHAAEVLADHAGLQDDPLGDTDRLTVTFTPPSARMS